MTQKDYYRILGVEPDADAKEIKDAYRQMAFQYHPDRNEKNPEAAEKMKTINEAYAVLSNPSKKSKYDALRQQFGSSAYQQFRTAYSDQDIFTGSDIQQIFEEMARSFGLRGFDEIFGFGSKSFTHRAKKEDNSGGMMGKLSRFLMEKVVGIESPENGADMNDMITLNPKQARQGGDYPYFHRKKGKNLMVKIPPNIREGQFIRLSGMGGEGKGGGRPGDLYLKIRIKKSIFQRMKDFVS